MDLESRWIDAVHLKPDKLKYFWSERLKRKKDILIITGLGWDPRTTVLSKTLSSFGGEGLRHLHLIQYSRSKLYESPHEKFIKKNYKEIEHITKNWAKKEDVFIATRKEGNSYRGDSEISKKYVGFDISGFSDILVDISSLPKSLYFTLLLVLVKKSMDFSPEKNIHVVACHDVDFDNQITESTDDIRRLIGFKGKDGRISAQSMPIILVPIISKNHSISLSKICDKEQPEDIYPILPFPSENPGSDVTLLDEYRHIFLDERNINPSNIIYAAENDPLNVYRRLIKLYNQQKEALEPLGEISMVLSALSSKLSSIGGFMAAYEKKMAVVHAIGRHNPPDDMNLDYWDDNHMEKYSNNLHSIWLTGEPYE